MKESSEENLGGQDSHGGRLMVQFSAFKGLSLAPKVSHEARPAEPGFEQGG